MICTIFVPRNEGDVSSPLLFETKKWQSGHHSKLKWQACHLNISKTMIDKEIVIKAAEGVLASTDGYLVDVTVSKDNDINVEIDSDSGVDIDTCVAINNAVEAALDRDVEDYSLQVGSSGLTSPFKVKRQYLKNVGNDVEVLSDGKRYTGILKSAGDDEFVVEVMIKQKGIRKPVAQDITFKYSDVKYTKYNLKFN